MCTIGSAAIEATIGAVKGKNETINKFTEILNNIFSKDKMTVQEYYTNLTTKFEKKLESSQLGTTLKEQGVSLKEVSDSLSLIYTTEHIKLVQQGYSYEEAKQIVDTSMQKFTDLLKTTNLANVDLGKLKESISINTPNGLTPTTHVAGIDDAAITVGVLGVVVICAAVIIVKKNSDPAAAKELSQDFKDFAIDIGVNTLAAEYLSLYRYATDQVAATVKNNGKTGNVVVDIITTTDGGRKAVLQDPASGRYYEARYDTELGSWEITEEIIGMRPEEITGPPTLPNIPENLPTGPLVTPADPKQPNKEEVTGQRPNIDDGILITTPAPQRPSVVHSESSKLAGQIATGHAYDDHVLEGEYGQEIGSRQEFADLIEDILIRPSATKHLERGRTAYWDDHTGTVVVVDPNSPDGGTAFRPKNGKKYFNNNLK